MQAIKEESLAQLGYFLDPNQLFEVIAKKGQNNFIIEELEATKRGLYSGAVGYFTPEGDFDFNVVIRSILYNQKKQYLSFSVGSAITALSVPEQEYEECLLKAKAMKSVLE